jgi:hypothetical protein
MDALRHSMTWAESSLRCEKNQRENLRGGTVDCTVVAVQCNNEWTVATTSKLEMMYPNLGTLERSFNELMGGSPENAYRIQKPALNQI